MTDINEIIGRALLTFKNEDDYPLVQETGTGEFFMEGSIPFADIGAAVVKALNDAGYAVKPKVLTMRPFGTAEELERIRLQDNRPGAPTR